MITTASASGETMCSIAGQVVLNWLRFEVNAPWGLRSVQVAQISSSRHFGKVCKN